MIVVAAGQGVRARTDGTALPKQYMVLAGKPVLERSIAAFQNHPDVDIILPVIGSGHQSYFEKLDLSTTKLMRAVPGSDTRQGSVLAGLRVLVAADPDYVLIHDAARPLVDPVTITNVIDALESLKAALPVVAVTDTIKRSSDGLISQGTEDRSQLWAAQTPQGFHFAEILQAHMSAAESGQDFTDDASIAEWAGLDVRLVEGDTQNLKVTRPEDFARAEHMLETGQMMETRTGTGLDIHRFVAGDHVRLAEVDIPHSAKLSGHSDADIALHVLTDALLGALADGDIGQHFPPSDAQWKDAPSRTFLDFAVNRVTARNGRIVHLDLTLMCEAPKIGPASGQMRANIAAICGIAKSRVSVKATTAEKMGFVGREEGMFAQATATIELPREED